MTATASARTRTGVPADDAFADRVAEDVAAAMGDFLVAVDRFVRPSFEAALVERWLPALGGPVARLSYGGQVADVGCGDGATTVRLAGRFPLASVHGFDADARSLDAARAAARCAGVDARCRFSRAEPHEVPAGAWDVVLLSRLHGLPDPAGAARRARRIVAADGVVVVVGAMGGASLGATSGPVATSQLLRAAGFAEVRAAAATPHHFVLAAHPPR